MSVDFEPNLNKHFCRTKRLVCTQYNGVQMKRIYGIDDRRHFLIKMTGRQSIYLYLPHTTLYHIRNAIHATVYSIVACIAFNIWYASVRKEKFVCIVEEWQRLLSSLCETRKIRTHRRCYERMMNSANRRIGPYYYMMDKKGTNTVYRSKVR